MITIGETKYLSEHSCNLMIWPSFINWSVFLSTFSCRLIGTRRPFCCIGFRFSKNSALTLAFRIFPILVNKLNKFGYNLQNYVCNSSYSFSSWLLPSTVIPITFLLCTNSRPMVPIRSRRRIDWWLPDFTDTCPAVHCRRHRYLPKDVYSVVIVVQEFILRWL